MCDKSDAFASPFKRRSALDGSKSFLPFISDNELFRGIILLSGYTTKLKSEQKIWKIKGFDENRVSLFSSFCVAIHIHQKKRKKTRTMVEHREQTDCIHKLIGRKRKYSWRDIGPCAAMVGTYFGRERVIRNLTLWVITTAIFLEWLLCYCSTKDHKWLDTRLGHCCIREEFHSLVEACLSASFFS